MRAGETITALLPDRLLLKRGDIMRAFGLSRREFEALTPGTFRPVAGLPLARARYHRDAVVAVAQRWAPAPDHFPKAQPPSSSLPV